MVDLIVFPDVDVIAHAVLNHGLADLGITGVPIATKKPNPLPERFIRCFALPGRELCRRTQLVQVIAQIYDGADEVRCAALARLCGSLLRSAPDMVIDDESLPVTEPCEKNGPYPSKDPDLPDFERYQLSVTWTVQSTVNV